MQQDPKELQPTAGATGQPALTSSEVPEGLVAPGHGSRPDLSALLQRLSRVARRLESQRLVQSEAEPPDAAAVDPAVSAASPPEGSPLEPSPASGDDDVYHLLQAVAEIIPSVTDPAVDPGEAKASDIDEISELLDALSRQHEEGDALAAPLETDAPLEALIEPAAIGAAHGTAEPLMTASPLEDSVPNEANAAEGTSPAPIQMAEPEGTAAVAEPVLLIEAASTIERLDFGKEPESALVEDGPVVLLETTSPKGLLELPSEMDTDGVAEEPTPKLARLGEPEASDVMEKPLELSETGSLLQPADLLGEPDAAVTTDEPVQSPVLQNGPEEIAEATELPVEVESVSPIELLESPCEPVVRWEAVSPLELLDLLGEPDMIDDPMQPPALGGGPDASAVVEEPAVQLETAS
ncbi:MAG: hypothetical protein JNM66_03775, partial [Bryobacterales bacterium]|nr:hypothetical protein [Bryobacterales bacterium]